MPPTKDCSLFAEKIGIQFHTIDLLKQAFTHRSYLNENPHFGLPHNERLEFLGDAVLELVVTKFLFQKYPDKTEGDLTSIRAALVNTSSISAVASELGMNDYLLLSKGEARDIGRARTYILANTFESVVGAIYLDLGFEAVEAFITRHLLPHTENIVKKRLWQDAKSFFQERAQEKANITPQYRVLRESGPDHDKFFESGVFLGDDLVAKGEGKSKQEAEQNAAHAGLGAKGWG
ncbi:ribonuclease III [bacterium]|nr:ribonuclease III [bacterium]MCI0566046.1 ribonuclease III [bacterium]MCI0680444.1 ribonuclease III [bacterium]